MDKLKMHSPDLTEQNIDRIAELFPTVVTESRDGDGNPVRAIDFDLLRQELSDHVVEGPQERYQLDWPGKREALFAANAPIAKTLRPVREESVDFDTTKNLFIEGDNLDALKLLQESYLGKVKLIYIDPPYNTGSDLVYEDDYAASTAEYLVRSGQSNQDGTRLVANSDTNGRFHSDWLSMMYPRIKLARNLLADDGFLFVSIDDGEHANLRRICTEIFGEPNFVCSIMWRRKRETSNDSKNVAIQGEYVLVFARSSDAGLNLEPLSEEYVAESYRDPTEQFPDGRWRGVPITVSKGLRGGGYEYSVTTPSGETIKRTWAYPEEGFARLEREGRLYWGADGSGVPQRVMYAHESRGQPTTNYWHSTSSNKAGKKRILELFGDAVFDTAKPPELIERIIRVAGSADALIVDFFSGASTTAEAVMRANAADGGSRRFVMVQIAEQLPADSLATRQGYQSIAQLSAERIRRAAESIRSEFDLDDADQDMGVRYLRIDTTNLAGVRVPPDSLVQGQLDGHAQNVKPDRTNEDLLFQVMLEWGLDLSMSVTTDVVVGDQVLFLENDAVVACFEPNVRHEVVHAIATRQPLRAVFRDSGFASDDDRINVEQIFAELSPHTDVKVI